MLRNTQLPDLSQSATGICLVASCWLIEWNIVWIVQCQLIPRDKACLRVALCASLANCFIAKLIDMHLQTCSNVMSPQTLPWAHCGNMLP